MTQPVLQTPRAASDTTLTRERSGSRAGSALSDALLERIGKRAGDYDRENKFFFEDFEELKEAGYLRAIVPRELGGLGISLPDFVREQARLAYRAPSTALALNMHSYWVGAALHLHRLGDDSADWILEEAARGKVFAAGHGEPGNDLGLAFSFTRAEPTGDGGYRFTGHKIFTSLAPVWDWLGVHGLDTSDANAPKIVHAFIDRRADGIRTVETWDALGVRATRSDDTLLEHVIAKPEHVTRVLPAGPPIDPFVDGILGWVLPGLGAVYYGVAKRAFDLAVQGAQHRKSALLEGKSFAHAPFTQWSVAQAAIELDAIEAVVERVARDFWEGFDHGGHWPAKLLAAKQHAVDASRRVVDLATKVAGAGSLSRSNELERLYRDIRAGAFHPPNTDATHDIIGKTYLGVL